MVHRSSFHLLFLLWWANNFPMCLQCMDTYKTKREGQLPTSFAFWTFELQNQEKGFPQIPSVEGDTCKMQWEWEAKKSKKMHEITQRGQDEISKKTNIYYLVSPQPALCVKMEFVLPTKSKKIRPAAHHLIHCLLFDQWFICQVPKVSTLNFFAIKEGRAGQWQTVLLQRFWL